jgi:hypothetical protein
LLIGGYELLEECPSRMNGKSKAVLKTHYTEKCNKAAHTEIIFLRYTLILYSSATSRFSLIRLFRPNIQLQLVFERHDIQMAVREISVNNNC